MLSEKITILFELLGCTNAEIAHYADCDRSYISHIRRGSRTPSPSSRAVARIVEGVYRYADNENILPLLCELTKTENESRDVLIPALVAWLFDTKETELPKIAKIPRRRNKDDKTADNKSFGERLDTVMQLLDLSNARLARAINVDNSLVSRFRNGVRSPRSNEQMSEQIVDVLLSRAAEQNRLDRLSKLCGISVGLLEDEKHRNEVFGKWLYDTDRESDTLIIDRLLESIDDFSAVSGIRPEEDPEAFAGEIKDVYWGNEGLREASDRFLWNTAREGGELNLYSDEDLDWMADDRSFLRRWGALMLACVKKGVKIKIIHNIDRGMEEMLTAIQAWMPLYMSGLMEPYVCKNPRDSRFSRTLFLHCGRACIHGTHSGEAGDDKWYDYITDEAKLKTLETDFERLRSSSDFLLKIYVEHEDWRLFRMMPNRSPGRAHALLNSFSLATLPEDIFRGMLERQIDDAEVRKTLISSYKLRKEQFAKSIRHGGAYEFVCLPSDEALFSGKVKVNLGTELYEADLTYTPEEFAAHAAEVSKMLRKEKNYHLYILPELPFPDIQIVLLRDLVVILRCKSPYAAFVFTEPLLCHAVAVYFESLKKQYSEDRSLLRQNLKRFI